MRLNRNRAGKISSSEAYKMYESKTVQNTYLQELRIYNLFGQPDMEKDMFNFTWGHLIENYLHQETEYLKDYIDQNSQEEATIFSTRNPYHCGTPDQYLPLYDEYCLVVSDSKAPVTLKGYYNLIFPYYTTGSYQETDGNTAIDMIRKNSKDGKKYYTQLVSNAVLLEEISGGECNYGELVAFMPYDTTLPKIVDFAEDYMTDYSFKIMSGTEDTLPCLKPDENGEYRVKECHKIRFRISEEEKEDFRKTLDEFTKLI